MFGNALTRDAEMPAELVQSLAILEMKLIEQGAPVWVGQGFKDIVHLEVDKCNQMVAYPFNPGKPTTCYPTTTDRYRTPWLDQFFR